MTCQADETVLRVPDFRSRAFLRAHVADIMDFYYPRCIDPRGGFFHFFRDDGSIYDRDTRHLVSSTRFIITAAMARGALGDDRYLPPIRHGLDYLRHAHRNSKTGGYAWILHGHEVRDDTNFCYGLAFVALAYIKALQAGVEEAADWLDETWSLMERRFWSPEHGLYGDEATADWQLADYRGQNANMHACEAWLAAYETTGEARYIERAALLAQNITRRQAALTDGMVWEHYHHDWCVDWEYNRGNRNNIFKPWGYQPGHQTEWAKLLLLLDRHAPAPWLLPRARELFDKAMALSWDEVFGGMVYGLDRRGRFHDEDKYYWVQAESLTAAALLAGRTGDGAYWDWYQRLWNYSWQHLVDHEHGAWYRILNRDNSARSDEKSPAGKTDYHTLGACCELLERADCHP